MKKRDIGNRTKSLIASGVVLVGTVSYILVTNNKKSNEVDVPLETDSIVSVEPDYNLTPIETDNGQLIIELPDSTGEIVPITPVEPTDSIKEDNSKEFVKQAQKLLDDSKSKLETIDSKKATIMNQIKSLQNKNSSLKNSYDQISNMLVEANKLLSNNSKLSDKLLNYITSLQTEVNSVYNKLQELLNKTTLLLSQYEGVNTSSYYTQIDTLQKQISKVKDNNGLLPFNNLNNSIIQLFDIVVKLEDDTNLLSNKSNSITFDVSMDKAKGIIGNMNDIITKDKNDSINSYIPGGGSITKEPTADSTKDKHGQVDEKNDISSNEPAPEPDSSEPVIIMTLR